MRSEIQLCLISFSENRHILIIGLCRFVSIFLRYGHVLNAGLFIYFSLRRGIFSMYCLFISQNGHIVNAFYLLLRIGIF